MVDLTQGFSELQDELRKISEGVDQAHINKALEAGAEIIVQKARALAPVNTGRLKSRGIVADPPSGEQIEIGWTKKEYYGRFHENGTSKMKATPHIRPAYEQNQNRIMEEMLNVMKLND